MGGNTKPCEACAVILLLALIAGCYVAGFGFSGWLAIGIGLNVWLVGSLVLRLTGRL